MMWRWRVLSMAVIVAAGLLVVPVYRWSGVSPDRPSPVMLARVPAMRAVYPYSVVPGGVLNREELAESMARDSIVREHFRNVRVERLAPVRLERSLLAHVSYRRQNRIGWTRAKLTIPAGELVLTDGRDIVRARCGNRVSVTTPAEPPDELEPPTILIDTPFPAAWRLPEPVPPRPMHSDPVPSPVGAVPLSPAPAEPHRPAPGIRSLPPLIPLTRPQEEPPCPAHDRRCVPPPQKPDCPPHGDSCAAPPPAPRTVPEPGSLLLLASGIALLAVGRWLKR